jgi:WD40 repeat protein
MIRSCACIILTVCTLVLTSPGAAGQSGNRRQQRDPELILETGARVATCDELTFTGDGKHLLAAGDDKNVRMWDFTHEEGLLPDSVRVLRWCIHREQRGSIYALALSPDKENRYVAVAGWGAINSLVAVIERSTGEIRATVTKPDFGGTFWALCFSPSGDQIAMGGQDGSIWLWNWQTEKSRKYLGQHSPVRQSKPRAPAQRIPQENDPISQIRSVLQNDPPVLGTNFGHSPNLVNHIRLVAYRDDQRLLSVAEDGEVLQWNTTRSDTPPFEPFQFKSRKVRRAALSVDGKWIAAASTTYEGPQVELHSLDGQQQKTITLRGNNRLPHSLAFDRDAKLLAVGFRTVPRKDAFYKELGGGIVIYDLSEEEPRALAGPKVSFLPDALAFHPDGKHLAVAGGNDHEVRLWNLQDLKAPMTEIRSPGSCLWAVALSPDSQFLGFRNQREANPVTPNRRAKEEPWSVFDLLNRKWVSDRELKQPVLPLESAGGWSVDYSKYRWSVVDPHGKTRELPWDTGRDGIPRCYTFLKSLGDKPVRLAIGHYWGISIFELGNHEPRRVRLFTGHQGEVMAVAPSADGKILVSASRDQTVAAWSLADWPSQPELGARFVIKHRKLLVEAVDPGSPAWECGLTEEDEVEELWFRGKKVEGGPQVWLNRLEQPEPGRELFIKTKAMPKGLLTTVRQRPLWRFFPTRDREWVLWRWRDYYYDTSTHGDNYIGWQVSRTFDEKPTFYRAEQFRGRFHRPDKVAQVIENMSIRAEGAPPFVDVEPPKATIRVTAETETEVKVAVAVSPSGEGELQRIERVVLWINNFRFGEWTSKNGIFQFNGALSTEFRREVSIPRPKLRSGLNVLRIQGVNYAQGRQDAVCEYKNERLEGEMNLYAILVGVGDYRKAIPQLDALHADVDALAMQTAWQAQKGRLFKNVYPYLFTNELVIREKIINRIKQLGKELTADDRFVLYLGGHGADILHLNKVADARGINFLETIRKNQQDCCWFCCSQFNVSLPSDTGIGISELYDALAELPCHKFILLDACHAGFFTTNPVRELTRDGVGPIILAACKPHESAIEVTSKSQFGNAFGLFTVAVTQALDSEFAEADLNKDGLLDVSELTSFVREKVGKLLEEIRPEGADPSKYVQTPDVFPHRFTQPLSLAARKKAAKRAGG